jgi:hypothetical protein
VLIADKLGVFNHVVIRFPNKGSTEKIFDLDQVLRKVFEGDLVYQVLYKCMILIIQQYGFVIVCSVECSNTFLLRAD